LKTSHTLFVGNTRHIISELADQSIGLIITSPPYWNIKDYEIEKQIGYDQTYEEYINSLQEVWQESKRILIPGCKLVINVGDQFLRAKDNDGIYEIKPIHADIIKTCQDLGFLFLGNIIWRKITTTNPSGGCSWMGSIYYPRDGYITYEHEYIMLFKKRGKAPRPQGKAKELSRLPKEFRSKWFRGIWDDLPPARQEVHCAMFPEELPMRIIRMFSFAGDTVLDPFVGSGTTMAAAEKWHRSSIGIDINPDFVSLVQTKVKNLVVMDEARVHRQAIR
jgi:DNA modification methylase